MLNIFKSKKAQPMPTVVEVATIPQSQSTYPAIVHEIHREFLTAGDRILEEAKIVLTEAGCKSVEKGKRLAALGFKKTPEAVEATSIEMKISITKATADLVEYYAINYPNNKFITEESVKEICEKYGLVSGGIELYKGFVPEVKLAQIENFKIKQQDKIEYIFHVNSEHNETLPKYSITEKDLTEAGKKYMVDNGSETNWITGSDGVGIHSPSHFTEDCMNIFRGLKFVQVVKVKSAGLEICAPIKDMDTTGMDLKGHQLVTHIPDPIVTQKVQGGRLIVAAWGNEASDELVVNQTHN